MQNTVIGGLIYSVYSNIIIFELINSLFLFQFVVKLNWRQHVSRHYVDDWNHWCKAAGKVLFNFNINCLFQHTWSSKLGPNCVTILDVKIVPSVAKSDKKFHKL